ncbi:MAG: hypothetical protein WCP92_02595 [bacterium]
METLPEASVAKLSFPRLNILDDNDPLNADAVTATPLSVEAGTAELAASQIASANLR